MDFRSGVWLIGGRPKKLLIMGDHLFLNYIFFLGSFLWLIGGALLILTWHYLSPESPPSHFIPRHADSCLQEVLIECPLGYLTAVLIKVKPGDLWLVRSDQNLLWLLSMCHWSTLQLSNSHQAFTCATSESSCFHSFANQAGRGCCTPQVGCSLYFDEEVIQAKAFRLLKNVETLLWQKTMKKAQLVTLQYDQLARRLLDTCLGSLLHCPGGCAAPWQIEQFFAKERLAEFFISQS